MAKRKRRNPASKPSSKNWLVLAGAAAVGVYLFRNAQPKQPPAAPVTGTLVDLWNNPAGGVGTPAFGGMGGSPGASSGKR